MTPISPDTLTVNVAEHAIAGDWCAAAALDDDQLDVPGYRPRYGWKPATGTGVAPAIRPPARRRTRTRR